MDTIDATACDDETLAEYIAGVMHDHHDMDVSFEDHARHIVRALRAYRVLADASLDIDTIRDDIAHIDQRGRAAFGDRWHFATVTIWGGDHRKRHAAVSVTLHIHASSKSFYASTPAEAIRDAARYIAEHSPEVLEAQGWATLGVERVA